MPNIALFLPFSSPCGQSIVSLLFWSAIPFRIMAAAQEMASLDSDYDYDDEDMEDMGDYYDQDVDDSEAGYKKPVDPEEFDFELLKVEDVDRLLNEAVEALSKAIKVCICTIGVCK